MVRETNGDQDGAVTELVDSSGKAPQSMHIILRSPCSSHRGFAGLAVEHIGVLVGVAVGHVVVVFEAEARLVERPT